MHEALDLFLILGRGLGSWWLLDINECFDEINEVILHKIVDLRVLAINGLHT